MAVQNGLRQAGMTHIVTDTNMYNAAKRLQETAGFKQEGEFFTPPGPQNPPPQPSPPPELLKEQMRMQDANAQRQHEIQMQTLDSLNGQTVARIQKATTESAASIRAAADLKSEE